MFMAAAPDGERILDDEREDVRILDATRSKTRVHLVVEETGALAPLGERVASGEGPFDVVHVTCHGGHGSAGPVLYLETLEGRPDPVGPGQLIEAYPTQRPALAVVSACRTAESGDGTVSAHRCRASATASKTHSSRASSRS